MDLTEQFKDMQSRCHVNPYPQLNERINTLLAIKKGLQAHAHLFTEAINQDFIHRAKEETLFLEIFPIIKTIDFCLHRINKWVKKRKRSVSWLFMPAQAYLIPQPLGVVGNIVPWNYPLYLALAPAVYALAAGNRVLIKMSELSLHTGKALESFLHSLQLDHFIQVVNGDVSLSKQFASLPFGHLLFTGSTEVGKLVMKAASDNLTPVTLELGGKSPAIISNTINPRYFSRLFMGKLFNAAQTCVAPDYLLIPMGWAEKIEKECRKFIASHYPDLMNNEDYSSIISPVHRQRLLTLVDDAKEKGACVVSIGEFSSENTKLPLYLLFGVTPEMKVMQEEIFGPLLPIINYKSLDEAVKYINSLPNPLALYYFGEDKAEIKMIQCKTLSGALTINDTVMQIAIDDLPFGGVGCSGMGHYHGREGFDQFSKLKPVLVQKRLSPVSWLYPPYGRLLHLFLRYIGRIRFC